MVFIGHLDTKGYWIFGLTTRQDVVLRHVVFEDKKWFEDTFTMYYLPIPGASNMTKHEDKVKESDSDTYFSHLAYYLPDV